MYAYPVRTKGESLDALKDFNVNIVKKYNFKIKTLQSDADCIFKAKRIKKEMNLQLSAPYMHYQNGQIERDVGSSTDFPYHFRVPMLDVLESLSPFPL